MKVLIVGVGGLGCAAASYLGRSSVKLTLVDNDLIEKSNLNRQILYEISDIGKKKVRVAYEKLVSYSSVKFYETTVDLNNALELIDQHDVVVDCTDNPITKYIVALSVKSTSKLAITASVGEKSGYIFTFNRDYCLPCIIGDPDIVNYGCSDSNILKPLVGVLGSLQAMECIYPNVGKFREFSTGGIKEYTVEAGCQDSRHTLLGATMSVGVEVEEFLREQSRDRYENICLIQPGIDLNFKNKVVSPVELWNNTELLYGEKDPIFICRRGITAKKVADIVSVLFRRKSFYLIGGTEKLAVNCSQQ